MEELSEARDNLKNAMRKFNEAEPKFVEDAIYEITAAESHYSALLRIARENLRSK